MRTTVKVLAPKCGKDKRPMVSVQYIKLLGLAPTFRLSGPEYINFLSDTINCFMEDGHYSGGQDRGAGCLRGHHPIPLRSH